jgi:hypothetical protein
MSLTFAPPREPFAHGFGQAFRRDTEPGFERAIAGGQGIVKLGLSCKIAHAEAIEPIQRAGPPLAFDDNIDKKFLRVDV